MRSIWFYFLLGLVLVLSACSSTTDSATESDAAAISWEGLQIVQANDENISEERRANYRKDAEKLAVRYINNKDSTQTHIPGGLINLFYNGLIHVATDNHPEAREATNPEYSVHARQPGHPREIVVYVDTTASWIEAWRDSTTETGNEAVDELLDRFQLSLVEYRELESSATAAATLRSPQAINGYAVGRLFEQVDDISQAGSDRVTDGSDISVLLFDDYLRYTFDYGFGDCPSGCINRHKWKFKVYGDGTTEFISEEGDSLPGQ